MSNILTKKVDDLKQVLDEAEVDYLERSAQFRLSDAIREGASVSGQAFTWSDNDNLCTLSAAVVSAKTRGYL